MDQAPLIILESVSLPPKKMWDGMHQGWGGTIKPLRAYVANLTGACAQ